MSSKGKCLIINIKITYDFVYVFHRHIAHNMHHFGSISSNRSPKSKLNLSDLEMTFRVISHLSYFRTGLVSQQRIFLYSGGTVDFDHHCRRGLTYYP